ncbi:MAG: hypothetical protein L6R42_001246 [Xanthoria sp. 1 TBL-2021]|nr:MAG: hypothetical protein L6R42_001246 [Xanthoria sp. 1 TBL-2021]
MGCCHSTAHSTDSSSTPYLPHQQPPTTSSSRATAQQPSDRTSSPSIRTSSHTTTLAHPSSRRHLPAHEHFNAPLRPHKPSPTSPSSRHAPRTWTLSQLRKEREEFFETRVTGRAEIWGSLKLCCESLWEGDVATAQGILDAVGVTVPTGDLVQGAYDEMGGLYVLPGWVVGEPEGVVDEEGQEQEGRELVVGEGGEDVGSGEKGKEVAAEGRGGMEGMVRVRARLSDRGGPDVVVLVGRKDSVGVLARRVVEQAKLLPKSRIRIAYLGKMLKEGESLQAQGWKEGHVVNALVFQ